MQNECLGLNEGLVSSIARIPQPASSFFTSCQQAPLFTCQIWQIRLHLNHVIDLPVDPPEAQGFILPDRLYLVAFAKDQPHAFIGTMVFKKLLSEFFPASKQYLLVHDITLITLF